MKFPKPSTQAPRKKQDSPIDRNIKALLDHRRGEQERRTRQDRIADTVTAFTGSMPFVYLHLALFGTWIVMNLPWTPFPKFDPSFVVLAMFASVEAIFLSTFVLITQNRMASLAEKRAELDLQISLLAEQEITQLINMVTEIAERMKVEIPTADLEEMKKEVHPEEVLQQLDQHQRAHAEQSSP